MNICYVLLFERNATEMNTHLKLEQCLNPFLIFLHILTSHPELWDFLETFRSHLFASAVRDRRDQPSHVYFLTPAIREIFILSFSFVKCSDAKERRCIIHEREGFYLWPPE